MGLEVAFLPYPDTASFYVGIRNGDCDFGVSAVELSPARAACPASCPDTAAAPLPVMDEADYGSAAYLSRLENICCIEYGLAYYKSGFSILSLVTNHADSIMAAILSIEVLNAATPVLIAIMVYGTAMWLLERPVNRAFSTQTNGIYYAFVATATFGFGDVAPVTAPGRLLTVFWTIFTVLSLAAFSGIISSKLTVGSLSIDRLDNLAALDPSQVCIEANYALVNQLIADTFSLEMGPDNQVVNSELQLGTVESCVAAVLNGTALAFVADYPLLNWLAFGFLDMGGLYVSQPVQDNPLSWAYASGSALRPILDAALMQMMINGTVRLRRETHRALTVFSSS